MLSLPAAILPLSFAPVNTGGDDKMATLVEESNAAINAFNDKTLSIVSLGKELHARAEQEAAHNSHGANALARSTTENFTK